MSLLPTSHSNGFSAVKVGEGDCRRVLQGNKISSGEAQEDLDGHRNYFQLIYFLWIFTFKKYFQEISTEISFLGEIGTILKNLKTSRNNQQITCKSVILSLSRSKSQGKNRSIPRKKTPPLSCCLSIISREAQLRSLLLSGHIFTLLLIKLSTISFRNLFGLIVTAISVNTYYS